MRHSKAGMQQSEVTGWKKKTQGTHSLSHSGEYRESFKPENLPLNYKKPKEQEMRIRSQEHDGQKKKQRKRKYKRQIEKGNKPCKHLDKRFFPV